MANVYLFVATVLWGIWGFAQKQATLRASPGCVQWMYSLPYVVFFVSGWAFRRLVACESALDRASLTWSVIAGVSAIVASLLFLLAMSTRSASTAVALTSAYPIVTLSLGVLNRTESIRLLHLSGLCLVAGGAFLLNLAD